MKQYLGQKLDYLTLPYAHKLLILDSASSSQLLRKLPD
jgi:hypothetical protein